MDKVEALERTANETVDEKDRLAAEQALTASRLERAEQLTGGLGSEGVRWRATMVSEMRGVDVRGAVCEASIGFVLLIAIHKCLALLHTHFSPFSFYLIYLTKY